MGTKKEEILEKAIRDIHWMARRYADGRTSYATIMFNKATRSILDMGMELGTENPRESIWAKDGMGREFDGLSEVEATASWRDIIEGHLCVLHDVKTNVMHRICSAAIALKDSGLLSEHAKDKLVDRLLRQIMALEILRDDEGMDFDPDLWEDEPPSEPGLYWAKFNKKTETMLVRVTKAHDGELLVKRLWSRSDGARSPNTAIISWKHWWSIPVEVPKKR